MALTNIKYNKKTSNIELKRSSTRNCIGGEDKDKTIYTVGKNDFIYLDNYQTCWLTKYFTRHRLIWDKDKSKHIATIMYSKQLMLTAKQYLNILTVLK